MDYVSEVLKRWFFHPRRRARNCDLAHEQYVGLHRPRDGTEYRVMFSEMREWPCFCPYAVDQINCLYVGERFRRLLFGPATLHRPFKNDNGGNRAAKCAVVLQHALRVFAVLQPSLKPLAQ